MKKIISGLLALTLLLSVCAGCGADRAPDKGPDSVYAGFLDVDLAGTALEADGNPVPMELYLYSLAYSCGSMEYQLQMLNALYGMYGEFLDGDGGVKWDESMEGTPLSQIAREQAERGALYYIVLENLAAEHGAAFTEEDRAAMEEDMAGYIEEQGGEEAFERDLWEMGVSRELFERIGRAGYLRAHLLELAQDPASGLYQAPSADDAYVDHILLMTVDSATREPLSEEEIRARREQAGDLLAQLQSADDVETLFTQLADEYGEDPGRAAETGYLIDPDTGFVQEFKDAAFALKPGELSGIVESDYGYHILLRKELTESQRETLAANGLSAYVDGRLELAMESAVRSETLDGIDAGAFYDGYVRAVEALHPEDGADTAPGSADGAQG